MMVEPVPEEEEEDGGAQHSKRLAGWGCWAVGGMSWELERAPGRQITGAAPAVGGGDFIGPLGVWFPFKHWSPGQGLCCLQKAQQKERSRVWTCLSAAPQWQGCGLGLASDVVRAGHC